MHVFLRYGGGIWKKRIASLSIKTLELYCPTILLKNTQFGQQFSLQSEKINAYYENSNQIYDPRCITPVITK